MSVQGEVSMRTFARRNERYATVQALRADGKGWRMLEAVAAASR